MKESAQDVVGTRTETVFARYGHRVCVYVCVFFVRCSTFYPVQVHMDKPFVCRVYSTIAAFVVLLVRYVQLQIQPPPGPVFPPQRQSHTQIDEPW
jgi:hypothetical protein